MNPRASMAVQSAVVQSLEQRYLRAVSFSVSDGGRFVIDTFNDASDAVSISLKGNVYRATVKGDDGSVSKRNQPAGVVTSIQVNTRGGNDRVSIDPSVRVSTLSVLGSGNDTLNADGQADDRFWAENGDGSDLIVTDSVDFRGRNRGISITLDGKDNDGEPREHDNITAGLIFGTSLNDRIDASSRRSGIVVYAGGGDDTILGSRFADEISLGAGRDRCKGAGGNDVIDGEDGNDILDGGSGDDEVLGGDGSDTESGGAGNDSLDGEDGDDSLIGDDGDDALSGDEDDDTLVGSKGDDAMGGGDGDDLLNGSSGDDQLSGGDDADTLFGNDGDDAIIGDDDELGQGDDLASDLIDGGSGDDEFNYDDADEVDDSNPGSVVDSDQLLTPLHSRLTDFAFDYGADDRASRGERIPLHVRLTDLNGRAVASAMLTISYTDSSMRRGQSRRLGSAATDFNGAVTFVFATPTSVFADDVKIMVDFAGDVEHRSVRAMRHLRIGSA